MKYMTLSDIHLGHLKNRIIASQAIRFLNSIDNLVRELDVIFLNGDLYDRLLYLASRDSLDAMRFINYLIDTSLKYDIKLRVLNGTPSHDRGQLTIIESMIGDRDIDYKYVDSVHIEYMSDTDMHILYVPDEWKPNADDVYDDVIAEMAKVGISKVDLAMMHGLFEYQLPAHIENLPRHNSKLYLSIVRAYIHIGHIHKYDPKDRIIPNGSLDRLAHNEEEPKGLVIADVTKDNYSYTFIENTFAMTFKTIDLSNSDDVDKTIHNATNKLQEGSHIRLRGPDTIPHIKNLHDTKLQYPKLNITRDVTNSGAKKEITRILAKVTYKLDENSFTDEYKKYLSVTKTPPDKLLKALKEFL